MSRGERLYDLPSFNPFWDIIDCLRGPPEEAASVLLNLSKDALQEFFFTYQFLAHELYPEYRDEARGFDADDIRRASRWVVALGKAKYAEVWNDPSLLPAPDASGETDHSETAEEVYGEQYGEDINRSRD